jgi:hypothetical protein
MIGQIREKLFFNSPAVLCTLLFAVTLGMHGVVLAQGGMIIYPAKGQSQGKMEKDKYDCYGWAKGQTGFDPMQAGSAPPPPPQSQAPGGERVRGAARGAVAGVAIGAIAGDAGKGAAIGAASGTMIGGMKKRQKQSQQQQAQQQQNAAFTQAQSNYNRAFGACMEGRGYTVK